MFYTRGTLLSSSLLRRGAGPVPMTRQGLRPAPTPLVPVPEPRRPRPRSFPFRGGAKPPRSERRRGALWEGPDHWPPPMERGADWLPAARPGLTRLLIGRAAGRCPRPARCGHGAAAAPSPGGLNVKRSRSARSCRRRRRRGATRYGRDALPRTAMGPGRPRAPAAPRPPRANSAPRSAQGPRRGHGRSAPCWALPPASRGPLLVRGCRACTTRAFHWPWPLPVRAVGGGGGPS